MGRLFSTLSLIFIILGTINIISLANRGNMIERLTFSTTGAAFIMMINLYGVLAFISAIFGKK
ncbi:hypothetical protein [Jeotgalibacillus sp. JSM ZJ347]|uniref:hypothetical protein n=1 Tax=Jeotgalibacillus sp. JSM ZJ347 TaxID=3342117 RepID=UPI0035A9A00E